jgi:hypothetical protein
MGKLISALTQEYLSLSKALERLPGHDNAADLTEAEEAEAEGIRDRMFLLAQTLDVSRASNPGELSCKAQVTLDWIEPKRDLSTSLAASLCKDVITLFPSP